MQIAMNLDPITYHTKNIFMNRMKTAAMWTDPATKAAITGLDAQGYPTSLAAGVTAQAAFGLDPGEIKAPTDFVCLYDGTGTMKITAGHTVTKSSVPGRIVFTAAADNDFAIMNIMATSPADPVRNIRVVRADEEKLLAGGAIFRPDIIALLKGFAVLRFMDPLATNDPFMGHVPVDFYTYGAPYHMPVEMCIELANAADAQAWLNMHDQGDDKYQDDFIAKCKAAKKPPYVEWSNEVWNMGFQAFKRALAAGSQRYPAMLTAKKYPVEIAETYYGYRATLMAKKARAAGLLPVWGTQTRSINWAAAVLNGMADAGGQDSDFWGWAITGYVEGSLTVQSGPTLTMMASNDIKGALANILSAPAPAKSVASSAPVYKQHGDLARAHGWKLVAYECGPQLRAIGLNSPTPLSNWATAKTDIVKFFTSVLHDPGRAEFDEANLAALEAAGCQFACAFNLSGGPSEFGIFGYYGTPGWDVLQRRINGAASVVTPPPVVTPDPVPMPRPAAKPTLDELVADLDALKAKLLARG